MCGIAGFTHKRRNVDPSRIQEATEAMAHRGPDRQAVFRTRTVALGAARLKIIDLEGGDQPMLAEDGNAAIAFNGEIYNHLEIRRELEALGHRFESHADTETVLRAFLEWDTGCFSRLRGMFAVALWKEDEQRLVLARDRIGIKPLYVARRGEDIYFGSELKTLFVHPEIERRLDLAGLDCYLSLNYVPCPHTLIEGVEKMRPGTWLEWRNGTVRTDVYWQLPEGAGARMGLDEAAEWLDALLNASVREHLIADVPIGLWLSGGLDSSTILHYAANASATPIRTFSISFHGRSFDESASIRRFSAFYGTRHEQMDLNPSLDLVSAIEDFASYADEPNADAGALPVWFLSRMTRLSATVALSGEGADELFGGYVTYRANTLARAMRRLPHGVLQLARRAAGAWPVSDEKIGFEYKLKRFLSGCLMRPERAHVAWNGTFSEAEKRVLVSVGLPSALARMLEGLKDETNAFLRFDQRYYLPDDILAKVDRMSMAHSVEVRPPFLDHRIVEFAGSLPAGLKIRGSRQKIVLRHLMKDRLPGPNPVKRKIGFDIPAHEWLRG
ncbi:MAG TPA: asparagine synthase (glutamine-hydrolyzing), partial [Bryobacteraceae bacterium]|nr:asparagine synthase (glutamine-hydrolyzing) [Bryobacteraceae bacterium]